MHCLRGFLLGLFFMLVLVWLSAQGQAGHIIFVKEGDYLLVKYAVTEGGMFIGFSI